MRPPPTFALPHFCMTVASGAFWFASANEHCGNLFWYLVVSPWNWIL